MPLESTSDIPIAAAVGTAAIFRALRVLTFHFSLACCQKFPLPSFLPSYIAVPMFTTDLGSSG